MAIILGKKVYGRLETLQYANNKFKWGKVVIGISAWYGFWAWVVGRLLRRKSIYYCIDFYSPEIADNLLDRVFIWSAMQMDKFLCSHCDRIWDISIRINEGRLKYGSYFTYSISVPLSYPPDYIRYVPGDKHKVVFVGIVPYGLELVDNPVWLQDQPIEDLLRCLSECGIGISCWQRNGNNYYGDPGKTKLYSACGLPVIMTANSPYAEVIEKTQAGIVVRYDKQAVSKAIKKIQDNYEFYKGNVPKTWRYLNADTVFGHINVLD